MYFKLIFLIMAIHLEKPKFRLGLSTEKLQKFSDKDIIVMVWLPL